MVDQHQSFARGAALHGARCAFLIVGQGALRLTARFEMKCELGGDLSRMASVGALESIADALVQPPTASRRHTIAQNTLV